MTEFLEMPRMMYGTAWKETATTRLTELAVETGFAGIDTANQPRHYSEPLVGQALAVLKTRGFARESLFLQTKFTPPGGQDDRIPYDPDDAIGDQVAQSFASSLEHLQTDYLDAYLLHGPYSRHGLSDADWQVWRSLEALCRDKKAHFIGISNVTARQLQLLWQGAAIKPMIVQNRCFASQGWDREVRHFCREQGIRYQGFSLLTANAPVLTHPATQAIATRLEKTPAQIIFSFAIQIGMVVLTGTTSLQHMREDLEATDIELSKGDLATLEALIG